jgi:hypothetical protein
MNTGWITDRLPTAEDAVAYCVLVWDDDGIGIWSCDAVKEGQPWMPIPKPESYVTPKRWTVEWHPRDLGWKLWDWDFPLFILQGLTEDDAEAAQRICDIYNETVP